MSVSNWRKLSWKEWLAILFVALLLQLLKIIFLPGFYLFWNGLILLFGLVLTLTALGSRLAPLYGLILLAIGAGAHWLKWKEVASIEGCNIDWRDGFFQGLRAVDSCIDYSEPWVFSAQSALIAGAVILIFYVIWELSGAYQHYRRERVLAKMRLGRD